MQNIATDINTELMVPYKHNETEFQINNVKYNFYYFESHADKIKTYVPIEGRTPENYNEIVVDKAFMDALGEESKLGASIFLDINGEAQEFVICGFTDDKYSALTHPIRVSKVFAEQCTVMRNIPYTALVRINSTSGTIYYISGSADRSAPNHWYDTKADSQNDSNRGLAVKSVCTPDRLDFKWYHCLFHTA